MKKSTLFFVLIFLTFSFYADAQTTNPRSFTPNPKVYVTESGAIKPKPAATKSAKTNQTTKPPQQQTTYVRPTGKERFKRYVKSMVGPVSLARTIAGAGYSTWRNSPEEWGDQWEGFGRRVASGFGKNAIKQTTVYALDESFKLDSRFYRSRKKDFGSRLTNALISPVTAHDRNGKRVFGFPRLIGTYTANVIAYEAWYPRRYDFKDGLKSGTISLGFNAAFNVFKEFVRK
ncbi:MAG TPA: hypothetical protein VF721_24035 [Pyrinomonadaceae bacterium]|jgi:hypothetical protein